MSITIKKTDEEELYIINALLESQQEYAESVGASLLVADEKEMKKYVLTDRTTQFIMLDETFIGFSSAKINPENHLASIDLFCLYKDYEGYGFAGTALPLIEEQLKGNNVLTISVMVADTNEKGSKFLEQNGYLVDEQHKSNQQSLYTKTL